MDVIHAAVAGTLESCDVQVSIYPNEIRVLDIHLNSVVKAQFGDSILSTVREALDSFGIDRAVVNVIDRGALDWVIRSRTQAACCRATGRVFDWGKEDNE